MGYEVEIIALSFRGIYLPIFFQLGKMEKKDLVERFKLIRNITQSNRLIFDGGYACDDFYEMLSEEGFIFCSKVPKSWIFNNGKNLNVEEMRSNLRLKKEQSYVINAYRVKGGVITDNKYRICFKGGDKRSLITNDLNEDIKNIAEKTFMIFGRRWDIETCNSEIKSNFCFEKLPVRNESAIKEYLLTTLLALNIMTIIKLRNKDKLGNLFNKGFKKLVRFFIKVKARWDCFLKKLEVKHHNSEWFFRVYGFV